MNALKRLFFSGAASGAVAAALFLGVTGQLPHRHPAPGPTPAPAATTPTRPDTGTALVTCTPERRSHART